MRAEPSLAHATQYPTGLAFDVAFDAFSVHLTVLSPDRLRFQIDDGPFARTEEVAITATALRPGLFLVTWVEQSGATVVHVEDFVNGQLHSQATLPDGRFLQMTGEIRLSPASAPQLPPTAVAPKDLVLDAMTALFQRREASAVERLYAPDYIQHNPNIPQGREALARLVGQLSPEVFYEPGLMIAEGDYVAIHGRIRGWAPTPQVVVDIFRIENGQLAEHWDVLQDEVPADSATSGHAMFSADEQARQRSPR